MKFRALRKKSKDGKRNMYLFRMWGTPFKEGKGIELGWGRPHNYSYFPNWVFQYLDDREGRILPMFSITLLGFEYTVTYKWVVDYWDSEYEKDRKK